MKTIHKGYTDTLDHLEMLARSIIELRQLNKIEITDILPQRYGVAFTVVCHGSWKLRDILNYTFPFIKSVN